MAETLLEMEDVTLGYTGERVLSGINLRIHKGELVVIAGSSGCGKSTLLKGAVGLLAPEHGTIRLFSENLSGLAEDKLGALRQRVGFLFQGGALINSMTVAENVLLPLNQFSRLPHGAVNTLMKMKLAQVGLEDAMYKTPPELSGGMRKRAALARAMAMDPELMLCDEPSAGLDPVTAAGLDQLLLDLREAMHMTLVVVTHELGSIEAIADRVVMLAEGRLVFDGSLADAHATDIPAVRDFFSRKPATAKARGQSMLDRFHHP